MPAKASIVFLILMICGQSMLHSQQKPAIIFDTDMGPDYDDVGAITLLHALADSNQCTILATIASTGYKNVAAVLDVLNTYFNRPSLPVGVPPGNRFTVMDGDSQHWSDTLVANYPHKLSSNEAAHDAVRLYRQLLAKSADKSVTIITVGFFTNLAALLQSSPDQQSPLNGLQLVEKKVKRLVSMAGFFPAGREFNVHKDTQASIYVAANWPTEIYFSGFEIGRDIKSGIPLISNTSIRNSPIQDAFRISIPLAKNDSAGRMSWDQTAVLVAVKGFAPYYSLQRGTIKIAEDGSNTWEAGNGKHYYLLPTVAPAMVEGYINKLMQHQPFREK